MRARFDAEKLVGTEVVTSLGKARVRQHLASGGIAHVYLVDLPGLEPLALKLLRPELEARGEVVARFEREALAASRVVHENVLRVFESVQSDRGFRFFTAELLVGVDLADVLSSNRRLAPARAVRVVMGAAAGLAAAHAVGVVHRDVKPENLFLQHAPDGREVVKIVDFGAAWLEGETTPASSIRITMSSGFVGTPGYLSPEQAEGATGKPTADVYSLGVVLYEVIAGKPPYAGGSFMDVVIRHSRDPIPTLSRVSPELASAVRTALAKSPTDRFPNMEAFAAALARTPEHG
ncbi:MAG: serine/threonine-protein kinase [Polyangiaceae bacterium]